MATMEPPKRPRSGYFIFVAENRATFRNENPGASVGELGKIAGEKWKTLDPLLKQKYEDQAATEKQNYQTAVEQYQQYLRDHPELNTNVVTPEKYGKNRNGGMNETDTENDDNEDNEDESLTVTSIPLARMKRLLSIDKEVKSMGKEALFLITAATEMFAQMLAQECAEVATENKRKTINNIDLAYAVARIPTFFFLQDDFPRPTPEQLQAAKAARLQAMLERKKANDESKEGNKDGTDEHITGENMNTNEKNHQHKRDGSSEDGLQSSTDTVPVLPPKPKMDILAQINRAAALAPALPKPVILPSTDNNQANPLTTKSSTTLSSKKDGKSKGKSAPAQPPPSALDRFILRLDSADEARATWNASFAISEKNRPLVSNTSTTTTTKDKTNKTKSKGKKRVPKILHDENGNVIEIEDDGDTNDNNGDEEMDEETEKQQREAAEEEGDIDLGFIRRNHDRKGRRKVRSGLSSRARSKSSTTKKSKKGKTVSLAYDDEDNENMEAEEEIVEDENDDGDDDNIEEEDEVDEEETRKTTRKHSTTLSSRAKLNSKAKISQSRSIVREEINLVQDEENDNEIDDGVRKGTSKQQSYVYEGIEDIDKEDDYDGGKGKNDDEDDDEIDEFSQEVPPKKSTVLPRSADTTTSGSSRFQAGTTLSSASSSSNAATNKRKLSI